MESCVGLTVATAVQSMPVGLAGGRRNRIHPAQRSEGSLGAQALWVAAGRDQQSCAVSSPTPKMLTRAGFAIPVSRSSWTCSSWISLLSWR